MFLAIFSQNQISYQGKIFTYLGLIPITRTAKQKYQISASWFYDYFICSVKIKRLQSYSDLIA